jgi:UDP-N-acetylmuramoyl-tripeptide--D-alanyl-D-alanine ligase
MIEPEYYMEIKFYWLVVSISFLMFWSIQAVAQILNWIYWIQVKEYRLDRFNTLFFNRDGRVDLGINFITAKIGFLLISLIFKIPLLLFSLVVVYLGVEGIVSTFKRSLRVPVLTKRTFRIITLSLIFFLTTLINLLFIVKSQSEIFITILIGEILLIVGPAVGVIFTGYLVSKTKISDIRMAKEKISKINPKVIGVTGSYGKTTTKEFIYQLLSTKHKTSKTPGSHNTEFGLARSIISNLNIGHKFFVAEYGAYKIGEIKKLTEIARPDVSVVTAVEPQHLEIFGSLEKIAKAKYELVESLPKGGIAIFNIGNLLVEKMQKKALLKRKDLKIFTYLLGDKKSGADITGKIDSSKNTLTVNYQGDSRVIKLNLPIEILTENLLPAILIARLNGVGWNEIEKKVRKLKLPERTLNVIKKNNLTFIDDSHNSSPTGFKTAIELLGKYDGVKYAVTPGIIELGTESKSVHTKLAKKLNKIGIKNIYLTKADPFKYFKSELGHKAVLIKNSNGLNRIKSEDGPVVLLEGRVPSYVMKYFKLN